MFYLTSLLISDTPIKETGRVIVNYVPGGLDLAGVLGGGVGTLCSTDFLVPFHVLGSR